MAYGASGLRLGQGACADDGAALGPGNLVLIEESLDGSSYLVRFGEENSVRRPTGAGQVRDVASISAAQPIESGRLLAR